MKYPSTKKGIKKRSYVQKQRQFARLDDIFQNTMGYFNIGHSKITPHQYQKAVSRRKRIHTFWNYTFPFLGYK